MKFHVVSVLSCYINSEAIDAFHAEMFHGRASRGGKQPTYRDARMAEDVDRPLHLHKNAYKIANVFAPEFELVVSSAVKDALADASGVKLTPVEFEVLFSYPYRAGDFSYWDDLSDYITQQIFIDEQSDDPELHTHIGQFFELFAPPAFQIQGRFAGLKTVSVNVGPTRLQEPLELSLSPQLLFEFPVFSCGGSYIMSEGVYSRLAPFVDWTYFTHTEGAT